MTSLTLCASFTLYAPQSAVACDSVCQVVLKFKRAEAAQISAQIQRSARKYGLDAHLLAAILAQESGFRRSAVNEGSNDYGLAQINERTIAAYGFDRQRLMVDRQYAIDAGARVLADFKQRFKAREPLTYWCRYNVGTGRLVGRRAENCLVYMNKVLKHYRGQVYAQK